jgi:hypothetical protein
MRNISFALTTAQVLAGTKTVTRRHGWLGAQPGELLQGVRKGQGLRKGEKVERVRIIRVVDVRREPLSRLVDDPEYGREEMRLEGFPGLHPQRFIDGYFGGARDTVVTRIAFEYTEVHG